MLDFKKNRGMRYKLDVHVSPREQGRENHHLLRDLSITVQPLWNAPLRKDHPVSKDHFPIRKIFCLPLDSIQTELVYNDHLSRKTTCPWHVGWSFQTGFTAAQYQAWLNHQAWIQVHQSLLSVLHGMTTVLKTDLTSLWMNSFYFKPHWLRRSNLKTVWSG